MKHNYQVQSSVYIFDSTNHFAKYQAFVKFSWALWPRDYLV